MGEDVPQSVTEESPRGPGRLVDFPALSRKVRIAASDVAGDPRRGKENPPGSPAFALRPHARDELARGIANSHFLKSAKTSLTTCDTILSSIRRPRSDFATRVN